MGNNEQSENKFGKVKNYTYLCTKKMRKNMDRIANLIKESKFYNNFAYKHHWLSGSSTYVYPISIWDERKEIVVQLDGSKYRGRKQCIDALMRKINEIMPYKYWYIRKSDGSCPSTLNIFFK